LYSRKREPVNREAEQLLLDAFQGADQLHLEVGLSAAPAVLSGEVDARVDRFRDEKGRAAEAGERP
jgi:hypothetical protein